MFLLLRKTAEIEAACRSVSVGGLAADLGMIAPFPCDFYIPNAIALEGA